MAENISGGTDATYTTDEETVTTITADKFYGDLVGNASTASALEEAVTFSFIGDASGSVTTDGSKSQSVKLTVSHATEADSADYASSSAKAGYATSAGSATSATTAGQASSASKADYAESAGKASYATDAGYAKTARNAEHAVEAEHSAKSDYATKAKYATSAGKADLATEALSARSVSDDTTVHKADYAGTADYATEAWHAKFADYDCEGYSIVDYYAKKSELLTSETVGELAQALEDLEWSGVVQLAQFPIDVTQLEWNTLYLVELDEYGNLLEDSFADFSADNMVASVLYFANTDTYGNPTDYAYRYIVTGTEGEEVTETTDTTES